MNTTSKLAPATANWIKILTEATSDVKYLILAFPLNILFLSFSHSLNSEKSKKESCRGCGCTKANKIKFFRQIIKLTVGTSNCQNVALE